MSQGSGSPVAFLDAETCENISQDLRGADGKLPDFDSVGSDPGSPPPALEAKVAYGERATQTSPVQTQDQATFVIMAAGHRSVSDQATQITSRPHQATSDTQTALASTSDQGTQVLLRPPRSVAFTQTATAPRSTRTSWTQVPRPDLRDTGTDMPPTTTTSAETQAGCYFDKEIIPPGAPRPKLPWAYTYAQFDQLLQAYLQEQIF